MLGLSNMISDQGVGPFCDVHFLEVNFKLIISSPFLHPLVSLPVCCDTRGDTMFLYGLRVRTSCRGVGLGNLLMVSDCIITSL